MNKNILSSLIRRVFKDKVFYCCRASFRLAYSPHNNNTETEQKTGKYKYTKYSPAKNDKKCVCVCVRYGGGHINTFYLWRDNDC